MEVDGGARDSAVDPDAGVRVDAGAEVDSGVDSGDPCETRCGGECIDLETDAENCGACGERCEAPVGGSVTCEAASCVGSCPGGETADGGACVAVGTPRQIAPLPSSAAGEILEFRWVIDGPADGVRLEICEDRACASAFRTVDVVGTSTGLSTPLPPGRYYWRLTGRRGEDLGLTHSPLWPLRITNRVGAVGAPALDINGDGYDDLAVGGSDPDAAVGAVFVYYGAPDGIAEAPATTITRSGGAPDTHFGSYVAHAGDVNGDGYSDIVVGAPAENERLGGVYLYLGGPDGLATTPAAQWHGAAAGLHALGKHVSSGGDLNGDGYGDLLLEAQEGDGSSAYARLLIVYGTTADELPAVPTLSVRAVADVGLIHPTRAGDTNGDGYDDLLVARRPSDFRIEYYVELYQGGPDGVRADDAPAATLVGPDPGPLTAVPSGFGESLAGVGDLNGDGLNDVAVVAPRAGRRGTAYFYEGSATVGLALAGETLRDCGGYEYSVSVRPAGDVDGDGYDDLLIVSPLQEAGRVTVYFGGLGRPRIGDSVRLPITSSVYYPMYGWSTATTDVNGDGVRDIVVSSRRGAGAYHDQDTLSLFTGGRGGFELIRVFNRPDGYQNINSNFSEVAGGQ